MYHEGACGEMRTTESPATQSETARRDGAESPGAMLTSNEQHFRLLLCSLMRPSMELSVRGRRR